MQISIYKIAEVAKVSPATVSRALNPALRHKVKPQTLDRILKYCAQHHYQGRLAARSLASGKTYCIGLVLADIQFDLASPFLSQIETSVIHHLESYGYKLKIIAIPLGTPQEMDRGVRRALEAQEVDGFIIGTNMIGQETIAKLQEYKIPAVSITFASEMPCTEEEISTAGVDSVPGFRALCEKLAAKGHESLAVIGNRRDCWHMRILKRETHRVGLHMQTFVFPHLSNHTSLAMFEMYETVRKCYTKMRNFTAWHFMTDLWALGGLRALRELAPDDMIAVSGYDNFEMMPRFLQNAAPELSTISPQYDLMGQNIVNLLFDHSEPRNIRHVLSPSIFIERNTTTERRKWKTK